LTDSLKFKKNYNLIIKNEQLFENFHRVTVQNLKYDSAVKDLLRVLIKLYENVLKDISSNPNSQIHLNFSDQEFQGDIQNMCFDEENNDKSQNVDINIKNHLYIFNVIEKTFNEVALDFCRATTPSDVKSHKKSLGVKK